MKHQLCLYGIYHKIIKVIIDNVKLMMCFEKSFLLNVCKCNICIKCVIKLLLIMFN